MRKFILLALLLSFGFAAAQEPLTASVKKTWTVDAARQEAFKNAKQRINFSEPDLDPELLVNRRLVDQGGGSTEERVVTVFRGQNYSVQKVGDNRVFYYTPGGNLFSIEFAGYKKTYPYAAYKHWTFDNFETGIHKGDLATVSLTTGPNESFGFLPDGTLDSHWLNDKCFKADGSSCGSRTSFTY